MQNVTGPWTVQMEAMKKAAVSSDAFLLISIPSAGFHLRSLLGVIPLAEGALGPEKNIGELNLKSFLRIRNTRIDSTFLPENKH